MLKFLHRIMYFSNSLFSSAVYVTYFRIVFLDTYTLGLLYLFDELTLLNYDMSFFWLIFC